MDTIDSANVSKELLLDDGSRIVLLDLLAAPVSVSDEEVSRNVYKLSATGSVQWQIKVNNGVYPRTPFTGIYWSKDGYLMAYRWDGTEYIINVETGKAEPHAFLK